ncbi:peptidoglycan hydrolase-like protein with peptidoglycan-binding domain [Sanguibacter antarcticus]|uniref:Peptidoglycan hydrolase-like protein with peptidoglycan-binding domain n=1 Tax=Sanguibacter antarcticus TaxID=372484 RepID=A0A2A9E5P1_9MICO|nr:peptidoglycan hydrolase-like protein with peptidoglycan-binding domain [Sanguibacter antarcticus]
MTSGTLGRSATYTAIATWGKLPFGTTAANGTLTSFEIVSGETVDSGSQLFAVDLRPVIALSGAVPSFRDLTLDSEGADVSQLQTFLRESGYLRVSADGEFGSLTESAVKKWQKHLGIEADGIVRASDVIFVPNLPARVLLSEEVVVGTRLSPGDAVGWALGPAPTFDIQLEAGQRGAVPTAGGNAEVISGATRWKAVLGQPSIDAEGRTLISVTAPDGSPVCGETCADVATSGEGTVFSVEVVTLSEATGAIVPVSAITTQPDGSSAIALEDGTSTPITVITSDGGRAVVEGIEIGANIRLFAPSTSTSTDE